MKNSNDIKQMVQQKYGSIATQSSSCCSCGCEPTIDYSIMADDYSNLNGYIPEADLNLGCGLPTEFADIKLGDTVLDLGSGAGNDAFIARTLVGDEGKVIGLDFTNEMIEKSKDNAKKLNFPNVVFRLGDIENMPIGGKSIDVVISNCVLNLVPDKHLAFREINRVLKPGGHFCISDIVLVGELTDKLKKSAEMYAGCVSGAIQKEEYLNIITKVGFTNVSVQKEKEIVLPKEILSEYLNPEELDSHLKQGAKLYSITVTGTKQEACCGSTSCC